MTLETHPNKNRFPSWLTAPVIEKIIREAYDACEKVGARQYSWTDGVEMIRQFFRGTFDGWEIEFWYNYVTKTIETAWSK